MTTPNPDAILEHLNTATAQGATCATLTPAIKAKLRELQGGQVLEVRVDDLSARDDIAAWCRLAGHDLLAAWCRLAGHDLLAVVEAEPRQIRCSIRKKSG